MAPTTEEEPVQKRGRGRPPKVPGQKKAAYVPTGRPRGRPKGSGGVKKATPVKKATTSTGRRGRPRKSDVEAAAAVAAAAVADETPAKKNGRGRPRKSDLSAAAPTPKKGASKKGAKGKSASAEADSSSSDEEANAPEDEDMKSASNADDSSEE